MYILATATEMLGAFAFWRYATAYESIKEALLGINWNGRARWVGPGPRVVRTSESGTTTRVAWVLSVDDAYTQRTGTEAVLRSVKESVLRALKNYDEDTWKTSNAVLWDEGTNGAIAWWEDGRNGASVTRTRDANPNNPLSLTPDQNPIGPDSAALRASTVSNVLDDMASGNRGPGSLAGVMPDPKGAISTAQTVLIVGVVGLGLYAAIRLVPMMTKRKSNPSGRRRRRLPSGAPRTLRRVR